VLRVDKQFSSSGERCEAWLYLPEGPGPHPCVVLAHGIGAIRQVRVGAYAERFTSAGYAVFALIIATGALARDFRVFCVIFVNSTRTSMRRSTMFVTSKI
jgi:cephalosporin-C deacetylase-like acetyl esterase